MALRTHSFIRCTLPVPVHPEASSIVIYGRIPSSSFFSLGAFCRSPIVFFIFSILMKKVEERYTIQYTYFGCAEAALLLPYAQLIAATKRVFRIFCVFVSIAILIYIICYCIVTMVSHRRHHLSMQITDVTSLALLALFTILRHVFQFFSSFPFYFSYPQQYPQLLWASSPDS